MNRAEAYATAVRGVAALNREVQTDNDPSIGARLIARAAALNLRMYSREDACQVLKDLANEMATGQ